MRVGVDQVRHDGLAGKVDPRGAGRYLHTGGGTYLGDLGAVHHDGAVVDGAAIADDDPGAFIGRDALGAGRTC